MKYLFKVVFLCLVFASVVSGCVVPQPVRNHNHAVVVCVVSNGDDKEASISNGDRNNFICHKLTDERRGLRQGQSK